MNNDHGDQDLPDVNQGEGDRASARRYDLHVREFVRHGLAERRSLAVSIVRRARNALANFLLNLSDRVAVSRAAH